MYLSTTLELLRGGREILVEALGAAAATEPDGFRMQRVDGEGEFGFDVHECALHKLLSAQGAPELTPLICRLDDVLMEYVEGLQLMRTGTIARGATRCDFRYHRR